MSTGNPPAGYYADPSIPGYIRYWDGNEWVAGTSQPAPEELADQVPSSSRGNAGGQAGAAVEQTSGQSSGQSSASGHVGSGRGVSGAGVSGAGAASTQSADTWQPEPSDAQVPQQSRQTRGDVRGYARPVQPVQPVQRQEEQPRRAQEPQQQVVRQAPQVQQYQDQQRQSQGQQYQSQQYAQTPTPTPSPVQQQAPTPTPVPQQAPPRTPVPQQSPAPEPTPAAVQQESESVATMIVPSAFGAGARTGTYKIPDYIRNPFSGLPGASVTAPDDEAESEAGETTVVELATPGSRFLARIIDIGIAAVFSAPITATLLLIAHRHDHQYILKLDSQATSTYTTLGMDALGIALWAGALLAFVIVSVVYEGYRLGRDGQTFGRKLAGVRVIKLATGQPLGRGSAGTRRALIFWVLAIIPVVDIAALGGVLWGRPYRQGVHEKATSTVTVKA